MVGKAARDTSRKEEQKVGGEAAHAKVLELGSAVRLASPDPESGWLGLSLPKNNLVVVQGKKKIACVASLNKDSGDW